MSDCNFCLYAEAEEIMYQLETEVVRLDEPHKCCECNEKKPAGSTMELMTYWSGCDPDDYETKQTADPDDDDKEKPTNTCTICATIRDTFYCEGKIYFSLWDDMDEDMAQLTTACLGRVKDAEAREFLRKRWMDWKGLRGTENAAP